MGVKTKSKFDQELRSCIKSRNNTTAISMLNIRAKKSKDFGRLLHHAAAWGKEEIIVELIKLGAEIDRRGRGGNTPLLVALQSEYKRGVCVLLEANANIDVKNAKGISALRLALELQYLAETVAGVVLKLKTEADTTGELADRLISAGCNMHHVAIFADVSLAQCMLERGIDIDSSNSDGFTALNEAVNLVDLKLAEWLINNGANVNARGVHGISALTTSVRLGNKDTTELLLKHGADPNNKYGFDGCTSLYHVFDYANRRYGKTYYVECVEILLQYGALPQNLDIKHTHTLFDLALFSLNDEKAKMLEILVSHLAMLELLGTPIAKSIMYCEDPVRQRKMPKYVNFLKQCQQVLTTSVCEKLSLIDLLRASEYKMKLLVRNETFILEVQRSCQEIKNMNTYYYNTLMKSIDKAKRLVELENKSILVICKLFKANYNECYNFARTAVGYLDERDLERLIGVC